MHVIPTGSRPYLDYLAPGIMAQSALFIAIFFGIQIIWERDAGMLTKLLATPTPRAALVFGKSFAAGVRGVCQVVVILVLCAILRIGIDWNPLHLIAAALIVVLAARLLLLSLDNDRRLGAVARTPDGHRPSHHHAALLRL